jgi:hypothetical protein
LWWQSSFAVLSGSCDEGHVTAGIAADAGHGLDFVGGVRRLAQTSEQDERAAIEAGQTRATRVDYVATLR